MLYKSVFKHLKKRFFQVILLTLIMIMSAFIYVIMEYSISALKNPAEDFFKAYVQEDFNVTISEQILPFDLENLDTSDIGESVTLSDLYHNNYDSYITLINNRLSAFSNTFEDTQLEPRLHKDIYYTYDDEQHLMRILKDMDEINQTYVTSGKKPQTNNEIALIEVYALANNLNIGDQIVLQNQTYTITGYVLFPDYTLSIFGNDFIINNQTRTLGLLSDQAFSNLSQTMDLTLGGIFLDDDKPTSYFNNHNLPFVLSIALTTNTMRSGAIYDEIAGAEALGLIISLVIASTAVIIVALMISRMLFEQRGAIGILKALGYKKREIALPYMIFVLIIALPGLLIGYGLGLNLATPMKNLFASIYLLPNVAVEPSIWVFIQSIIIPLLFLMGLGFIVVFRLLQKHPVELMRPPVEKTPKKLWKLPKLISNLSLLKKIKHAYVWRNKSRFIVFYTGVFTSVFLILIAFSMMGVFDKLFNDYYESIDVKYIAYCEQATVCETPDINHDKVLEIPYVMLDNQSVTVIGLSPDNFYHPLYQNGTKITDKLSKEGVIITESLSMEKGLKTGDNITLSYGNISFSANILGVQDELESSKVYVNREAISLYLSLGTNPNLFNAIYTVDRPTGDYISIIDIEDLLSQSEDMSQMMVVMSVAMTFSAIFIGVIVLLLILMLAIEHYFYDISLFKVIGYNNKEIKGIFINGYLIYIILIFLMVLPIALISFEVMMWYMSTQYGMIFPMTLDVLKIMTSLLITISIFYIVTPLAQRKVNQMSLADALKIYQSVS
jgi:putative ABC transport system permease protein